MAGIRRRWRTKAQAPTKPTFQTFPPEGQLRRQNRYM
jgi:hypothetical protein